MPKFQLIRNHKLGKRPISTISIFCSNLVKFLIEIFVFAFKIKYDLIRFLRVDFVRVKIKTDFWLFTKMQN